MGIQVNIRRRFTVNGKEYGSAEAGNTTAGPCGCGSSLRPPVIAEPRRSP